MSHTSRCDYLPRSSSAFKRVAMWSWKLPHMHPACDPSTHYDLFPVRLREDIAGSTLIRRSIASSCLEQLVNTPYALHQPRPSSAYFSNNRKTASCARGDTICTRPSPATVGAQAPRAPPSRRNVAVLSHAEYVPTLTTAAALRLRPR